MFGNKIKEHFVRMTKGEYNFGYMLYLWGVIPAIILSLFFQKKIDLIASSTIKIILYTIFFLYFLWHLYVIWKSLKVQPEHKVVKISKKDLHKDKTAEEIQEIKKQKRNDTVKKLMLLHAWDTAPNYVIVSCIDCYVILTQLQGIMRIF